MIERSNRGDRAHRLAFGENFTRLAVRCQVTGEYLPIVQNHQLPGQGKNVEGTARFVQGVLFADAEF